MENEVMNVEVQKDHTKPVRIALTLLLCLVVFGSGLLRSYQAGVTSQAAQVMREANNPAAIAAAQHQIQWAKNYQKDRLVRAQ
jgi:hypothetical protein